MCIYLCLSKSWRVAINFYTLTLCYIIHLFLTFSPLFLTFFLSLINFPTDYYTFSDISSSFLPFHLHSTPYFNVSLPLSIYFPLFWFFLFTFSYYKFSSTKVIYLSFSLSIFYFYFWSFFSLHLYFRMINFYVL